MRVRLAVAALANRVFINRQVNMAAGTRQINIGILITNRKLFLIYGCVQDEAGRQKSREDELA